MPAFAVKHVVTDQGSLSLIMKGVRETPYSFTSKMPEAYEAAAGNDVYVVEVREERSSRTYWLGYKYRAQEAFQGAGGGLWKGPFKFKNSATPGVPADGAYFAEPVRIEEPALCAWLARKQPGMAKIPEDLVAALDSLIANPVNGARGFA